MVDLLIQVANLSISASWLVLAVLLARLVLKKAPRWVHVTLWGLVGLRLVFPFSLESMLSLIPSQETIPPEIVYSPSPGIQSGVPMIDSLINPVIQNQFTPSPADYVNPIQIWLFAGAIVWLVGMALMLSYTLFTYFRLRRRVSTAVRLEDNVYQSEFVASPFVLGLFRPRVYLPYGLDSEAMAHVLSHEQAHIRRKDHWWKPLGFLLLTIYWFNPLLWVAYVLLCRDIELACDEKVVKKLDTQQRADYSQALLSYSVNRKSIAACPLAFGEVGVKQRIKSVLNYKKPAFWLILVAVVSCIALAVAFLTSPKPEEKPNEDPYISWIADVQVEDVDHIQLSGVELTPDEIDAFVNQLRKSELVVLEEEPPLGMEYVLAWVAVWLTDGNYHGISIRSDQVLRIDGVYYKELNSANDWAVWDDAAEEIKGDERPAWIQELKAEDVKEITLEAEGYSSRLTADELSRIIAGLRYDCGRKVHQAPAVTDPITTLYLHMNTGQTHLLQFQKYVYIDGTAYTIDDGSVKWLDLAYLAQHGQEAAQVRELCNSLTSLPAATAVTDCRNGARQACVVDEGFLYVVLQTLRELQGHVFFWDASHDLQADHFQVDIPLEEGKVLQVRLGECLVMVNGYGYNINTAWSAERYRQLEMEYPAYKSSLAWAQTLKAEDIASIYVECSFGSSFYADSAQTQRIVEILNQTEGIYRQDGQENDGGYVRFILETQSGSKYEVKNNGGTNFFINDAYYQVDTDWLKAWWEEWRN